MYYFCGQGEENPGFEEENAMTPEQTNNPLHAKTLENILNDLVAYYGWVKLGTFIRIKCFNENPSIKSSLKFLRATPWARKKVEDLYLDISKR
jgi:uncharacterized protein (DUF2132 family)